MMKLYLIKEGQSKAKKKVNMCEVCAKKSEDIIVSEQGDYDKEFGRECHGCGLSNALLRELQMG